MYVEMSGMKEMKSMLMTMTFTLEDVHVRMQFFIMAMK